MTYLNRISFIVALCALILSVIQFDKYQSLTDIQKNQLTTFENELRSELDTLEDNIRLLKGQDHAILTRLKINTWGKAEVDYLINLAANELLVKEECATAIELLTKALHKIPLLNDLRLEPLQAALATDLENLKQFSAPSRHQIWQQLSTLMKESRTLEPQAPRTEYHPPQTTEEPPTDPSWKSRIKEGLSQLKRLVKVQRHTKPIEPLYSMEESTALKQKLQLLLEQSRLATVTGDTMLYQQTLNESLTLLKDYFEDSLPLQESLETLLSHPLTPSLPTLSALEHLSLLQESR